MATKTSKKRKLKKKLQDTDSIAIEEETTSKLKILKIGNKSLNIRPNFIQTEFQNITLEILRIPKVLTIKEDQIDNLGVASFIDRAENCRKYIMFCCKAHNIEDHPWTHPWVRHSTSIEVQFKFIKVYTPCARSLLHRVRRHFATHRWNAEGNGFCVPNNYTEEKLRKTIEKLRREEEAKLTHFLLFLQRQSKAVLTNGKIKFIKQKF